MTSRGQDIVLGATLAIVASIWTWLVIETIPPGFGDGEIGARAFPLAFGLILLILSGLLLLRSLRPPAIEDSADHGSGAAESETDRLKWMPALVLLAEIALYGFLLEKIGFVLATPLVILLVMIANLRVRSIKKLFSFSVGLTLGCWLIFEKVMGIYLANGTWMNLG